MNTEKHFRTKDKILSVPLHFKIKWHLIHFDKNDILQTCVPIYCVVLIIIKEKQLQRPLETPGDNLLSQREGMWRGGGAEWYVSPTKSLHDFFVHWQ